MPLITLSQGTIPANLMHPRWDIVARAMNVLEYGSIIVDTKVALQEMLDANKNRSSNITDNR